MCFTIPILGIKRRARRDITCYKLVYSIINQKHVQYTSMWEGYPYEMDKINPEVKFSKRRLDRRRLINKGYHSYISLKPWISNYDQWKHQTNYVFIECKIPKGAKYYRNKKTNEYVSTQIIAIREIE